MINRAIGAAFIGLGIFFLGYMIPYAITVTVLGVPYGYRTEPASQSESVVGFVTLITIGLFSVVIRRRQCR